MGPFRILRKARFVSRAATTTIALSLVASGLSLTLGATPASASTSPLGVYVGAADPGGVRDFNHWLGRPVTWAMDFFAGDSWQSIESPGWWVDAWAGTSNQMVYSVPILPDGVGTLQQGATGAYNSHFEKLAQLLVQKGQGDAVLRLGWEFNGNWFRWAASSDPGSFVGYWRQIVTTMRSVPGASFKFDWCPNGGPTDMPADKAYPGDAYVDYIGMDFYDAGWADGWQDPATRWTSNLTQPFGLQWQRDFAAAHGKPMTYGEWGLWTRPDGHGGGDDPYFIQKMHDWIASNDVAYAIYFENDAADGQHVLENGQFPKAAAKFQSLFGPAAPAPDPTTPAPDPSTPAPDPSTPAPDPTSPSTPPADAGSPAPDPSPVATGDGVGQPAPVPTPDPAGQLKLCKPCRVAPQGARPRAWSHRVSRRPHRRWRRRVHGHARRRPSRGLQRSGRPLYRRRRGSASETF